MNASCYCLFLNAALIMNCRLCRRVELTGTEQEDGHVENGAKGMDKHTCTSHESQSVKR